MPDKSYYRSLMRSFVMIVILVSITPLLLISAGDRFNFQNAYTTKVFDYLEELAEKHRQNIDAFLAEKLADIRVLARTHRIAELQNDTALQEILRAMQVFHQGEIVDLGLVNESGVQLAYAGPFRLGRADYAQAAWFREAVRREFYISDVFLGLRGLPHFIIAVKRSEGDRICILRATIDFAAFTRLVGNIRIGETGAAFIINTAGTFQVSPREDLAREIGPIVQFIREGGTGPRATLPSGGGRWENAAPKDDIARGIRTLIHRNPDRGRDAIYITTPLKGGDWHLIYRQEEEDAFSRLYRARRTNLIVLLAGSLSILAMAVFLSRRVISRIRQADREKEIMNEQVIEAGKLASLGELAAGIAHEINNPVAIMVEEAGWVQDILEDSGDALQDEDMIEMKRALNQIRTQGGRCREITHKLLSFARRTDPTVRTVDINELIREVAALSDKRARYGNVSMETRLDPGLPRLQASPAEIQQVLLNLINNAIDAMERTGGRLMLRTATEPGEILIEVADTGPGIPGAGLQKVFDPFFTTKPVGRGTGLGLSICYGIIRKMGGTISVSSTVGAGATFDIRLPVQKEDLPGAFERTVKK